MNLKESFRYQNFLEKIMDSACVSLTGEHHHFTVTKRHLKKKANPDADDMEEVVDFGKFFLNDDVLRFMLMLIEEREKLTKAIGVAKASADFDMDAAVESNKFRQNVARQISTMIGTEPSKRMERGYDFKFNMEGNQVQYCYDIEVIKEDNFDREAAKTIMKEVITKADEVSAQIDLVMINTQVDYEPPFNVNDSFNDAMTEFLAQ